tara:strand:- start:773 stop:1738 length:966 start_codon:yes stop_codon:yes gene_type:complete
MKLTKAQLKKLVEEVILEESKEVLSEEHIRMLEEDIADVFQSIKLGAKTGLRKWITLAKASKANRMLDAALDTAEEASPEQKEVAGQKALKRVAPTMAQLADVFAEYEIKVRQANDKLQTKLKAVAIDPTSLNRLADMLSVEDEPELRAQGLQPDNEDDVVTGPPEGMEDAEGKPVTEAVATGETADAVYRAAAELVNWISIHNGYMDKLSELAGVGGTGGKLKELSVAIDPSAAPEAGEIGDVAMSATDPETPVGLAKDRKPRGGVEKARATKAPTGGLGGYKKGTIGTKSTVAGQLEETITLSEEKLKRLIKNELKNNK